MGVLGLRSRHDPCSACFLKTPRTYFPWIPTFRLGRGETPPWRCTELTMPVADYMCRTEGCSYGAEIMFSRSLFGAALAGTLGVAALVTAGPASAGSYGVYVGPTYVHSPHR